MKSGVRYAVVSLCQAVIGVLGIFLMLAGFSGRFGYDVTVICIVFGVLNLHTAWDWERELSEWGKEKSDGET